MTNNNPVTCLVVGSGWRSTVFMRVAELFPERLRVTGVVTRTAERGQQVTERWQVPTWRDLDQGIKAERPDYVIALVPWAVSPVCIRACVAAGLPVLCETPPAPDLAGLKALWSDVGASGLVQVAEQYLMYPGHQARLRVIADGLIGQVGEVEVSSSHQYHATSIMRGMLGGGFEAVTVTGHEAFHPLADPIETQGMIGSEEPKRLRTQRGYFEFASGQVGMYDFTDNQWWNPLRVDRVLIRGSRGEILDDRVTRMVDPRTVVTERLERRLAGVEMNFEGLGLDFISLGGQALFRNQWLAGRLGDDEIAVAELLDRMGRWVRGQGQPPYPLAEAAHDHALALAVDESIATGGPVRLAGLPWAG